jgi:tripartite-type tricarboxylate transporter receptor subunit TctC
MAVREPGRSRCEESDLRHAPGVLPDNTCNHAKPSPFAPGLPTVAAVVPGYESVSYLAILAPTGTPAAIVTHLHQEIARTLNHADVKEKFMAASIDILGSNPETTAALIKAETARMGKVIKAANIRAD